MKVKDTVFSAKHTMTIEGKLISLDQALVMGILNVTPDSFFDGGKHNSEYNALLQTEKMLEDGADFIDIGGYSTRPGANVVEEEEEIKRIIPIIKTIKHRFSDAYISIDTFRPNVAKRAVEAGACIVNDISGGELGRGMLEMVAALRVPYILMHSKGNPQTMQSMNQYDNLQLEVINYLAEKIEVLRKLGVKDIIIDPGFGFSKDINQNYELLCKLQSLTLLGLPILTGVSRKSMIYKYLDTEPAQALNGTTALHMYALTKGAKILRVHDVKEAVETVMLYNKLESVV